MKLEGPKLGHPPLLVEAVKVVEVSRVNPPFLHVDKRASNTLILVAICPIL